MGGGCRPPPPSWLSWPRSRSGTIYRDVARPVQHLRALRRMQALAWGYRLAGFELPPPMFSQGEASRPGGRGSPGASLLTQACARGWKAPRARFCRCCPAARLAGSRSPGAARTPWWGSTSAPRLVLRHRRRASRRGWKSGDYADVVRPSLRRLRWAAGLLLLGKRAPCQPGELRNDFRLKSTALVAFTVLPDAFGKSLGKTLAGPAAGSVEAERKAAGHRPAAAPGQMDRS